MRVVSPGGRGGLGLNRERQPARLTPVPFAGRYEVTLCSTPSVSARFVGMNISRKWESTSPVVLRAEPARARQIGHDTLGGMPLPFLLSFPFVGKPRLREVRRRGREVRREVRQLRRPGRAGSIPAAYRATGDRVAPR